MEIKDEERMATIPLIAHQLDMSKLMKIIGWLVAIIIIQAIAIGVGVYEFMSYDYADITVDGNDGSNAAYMGAGASGIINNGQSSGQEESQKE